MEIQDKKNELYVTKVQSQGLTLTGLYIWIFIISFIWQIVNSLPCKDY